MAAAHNCFPVAKKGAMNGVRLLYVVGNELEDDTLEEEKAVGTDIEHLCSICRPAELRLSCHGNSQTLILTPDWI